MLCEVPKDVTLTLEPGVIMSPSGMTIKGTLKAIGTVEKPIIFRDYYWDQEWAQRPGKWFGLTFTSESKKSELENIEINYAGGSYYNLWWFGAAIKADNCDISLKNSFIHDNQNNGLWLINSNSVIDNVKFLNHTEVQQDWPIKARAVYIQGGNPEIKNSYFETQAYGIYLDKWLAEDGTEISPKVNLHESPDDPDKNIFLYSDIFDFFDASAIH